MKAPPIVQYTVSILLAHDFQVSLARFFSSSAQIKSIKSAR